MEEQKSAFVQSDETDSMFRSQGTSESPVERY